MTLAILLIVATFAIAVVAARISVALGHAGDRVDAALAALDAGAPLPGERTHEVYAVAA